MSTNAYRVIAIVALLAFAAFALHIDAVTGNAARRSQVYAKVLPYCPEGCAYGGVMTLKTSSGFVSFGKNDLEFQWCHVPQKDGCLREGEWLYPVKFRGEPAGVLECVEHHWEFVMAMIPPCPPKLVELP
jgi:hypothetical protein